MTTYFGQGTAISRSGGTSWNFIPLTEWLSTDGIKKVRAAIEMRGATGSCKIQPAYAATNDKDVASGSMDIAAIAGTSDLSSDGINYGGGWDDIQDDLDGNMYVRFGVHCARTDGTGLVGCFASIRVDVKDP